MEPIVNGVPPMFVTVVFCAVLVVPTTWGRNERLPGVKVRAETTPVPVRFAVCGLLLASSETATIP